VELNPCKILALPLRIIESLRLEKTSKIIKSSHPPNATFFEHLQGWGLHHCPGQPVPMLHRSFSKEIFPNIQSKSNHFFLVAKVECSVMPTSILSGGTVRTCCSGVRRFNSVLSFVLNTSFTSQQHGSCSISWLHPPHSPRALLVDGRQPCQQKCPLPGGTGQRTAPHPKEPGHTDAGICVLQLNYCSSLRLEINHSWCKIQQMSASQWRAAWRSARPGFLLSTDFGLLFPILRALHHLLPQPAPARALQPLTKG